MTEASLPEIDDEKDAAGATRRTALKCMLWAGTGILWTVSGGVPRSLGFGGAQALAGTTDFTFAQISDSHLGFSKEANPDSTATFQQAIDNIKALPTKPQLVLHTGDVSHLSKPEQFDLGAQMMGGLGLDAHYVPGEHDVLVDEGKDFFARFSPHAKPGGWYSFDQGGIHFIGLVNVTNLQAGGFGQLGSDQLEWLEDDLKGKSSSTPLVVFTHIPLWMVYPDWGWGTQDAAQALGYMKRFGSVTVLNGHIHQVMQKVEGNVAFHTAMSTAFPQPAPGTAAGPGPMKVPAEQLKQLLGTRSVTYIQGKGELAVVDKPLGA